MIPAYILYEESLKCNTGSAGIYGPCYNRDVSSIIQVRDAKCKNLVLPHMIRPLDVNFCVVLCVYVYIYSGLLRRLNTEVIFTPLTRMENNTGSFNHQSEMLKTYYLDVTSLKPFFPFETYFSVTSTTQFT